MFFETVPVTLPPFFSMRALNSSRGAESVPVMTKVLPARGALALAAEGSGR